MHYETEELQKQAEAAQNDSSINGAKREFETETEAQSLFERFSRKIFDLDAWNSEGALSSFALFDENGAEIHGRALADGDFIRISLKGTGKYDWVRVAHIRRAPEEIVIKVKPTFDPTSDDKSVISHFFSSAAENNFCLLRVKRAVMFYVIGLNEETNTDETGGVLEKVRNLAAANLGSYFGVQSAEWTKFCNSFLEVDEEKEAKEAKDEK